jgi:hypothetical protein
MYGLHILKNCTRLQFFHVQQNSCHNHNHGVSKYDLRSEYSNWHRLSNEDHIKCFNYCDLENIRWDPKIMCHISKRNQQTNHLIRIIHQKNQNQPTFIVK